MSHSEHERLDLHRAGFNAFMTEFVAETDRAAVVLGAAKVDALLCQLLDEHLLPHPGSEDDLLFGDSPLSTFSARIKIAHRLGLIDDHFAKLLHVLRRLRNSFAHEESSSTLAHGPARDRALSLAQPFVEAEFYRGLVKTIASRSKRDEEDPGVAFRAVLAIFYMELNAVRENSTAIQPSGNVGLVEAIRNWKPPKGKESGS